MLPAFEVASLVADANYRPLRFGPPHNAYWTDLVCGTWPNACVYRP